ncbi:hypothetical protein D3C77_331580 [compost metagenome]
MQVERFGLADDSDLGNTSLRHAAVAAHWIGIAHDCVHSHQPGQCDAQRADDLLAHGLGDGLDAAAGFQLEKRGLDAIGHGAWSDRHLAGDFFGGEALSHPQQCFQFTGCQRLSELTNP